MPYDLKTLEPDLFTLPDPSLPPCDIDLLLYRIHAFKIRKQQSPPASGGNDHTILLHIQLILGIDRFGFA